MADEGKDKLGVVGKKKGVEKKGDELGNMESGLEVTWENNEAVEDIVEEKVEGNIEENIVDGLDIDWSKVDKEGTLYGLSYKLSNEEYQEFWEFYRVKFPNVYNAEKIPMYFERTFVKNLDEKGIDIVTEYFLEKFPDKYYSNITEPIIIDDSELFEIDDNERSMLEYLL